MRRITLACMLLIIMVLWFVGADLAFAAAAEPIESAATNWEGVTVHLMKVTRKRNVLTVKWAAVNEGEKKQSICFGFTGKNVCYTVDEENGTKYYVLTDKEGNPMASANEWVDSNTNGYSRELKAGSTARLWMKLPAPSAEITEISIFLNETEPFEDIPITDK